MIEKVNPDHPDKLADRIAGALVDYAYEEQDAPRVAFEVLLGHGEVNIIGESSVYVPKRVAKQIITRILKHKDYVLNMNIVEQDVRLAANQAEEPRAGDNGIFAGEPADREQSLLSKIARGIHQKYNSDGKYILDMKAERLIICQSDAEENALRVDLYKILNAIKAEELKEYDIIINPLGSWSGGENVDAGATNRKLGSDMGRAVTGGGLHGKDLSKADVAVNIYAHMQAEDCNNRVELSCAIGDADINGVPYREIVRIAKEYVDEIGGFERLAEWGLS
jgi:S-adenosylmethionine synthetase